MTFKARVRRSRHLLRRMKTVRYYQHTLIIGVILIGLTLPAFAERIYTFGTAVNAVASLDNNPRDLSSFPSQNSNFSTLYGLYPSISLNSTGLRSSVQLSYALGLSQSITERGRPSESHSFSGGFNTSLTRNLGLSFSNSFTRSSDFTTFKVLRGIILTPEGLLFDFDTIALLRNSYANSASLGLDYALSSDSSLSFGVGHSIRYFDEGPDITNRLSNQQGLSGNVAYSQRLNERTSWNASYSASRSLFDQFQSAITHNLSTGLSRQISPTVSLSLNGGSSYVQSLDTQAGSLGYNASFQISKAFEKNFISLSYSHQTGNSTGVGSVSNTDTLAFNFSRSLGRKVNIQANLSVYETSAVLDNPVETRGGIAAVSLGFLLSDNWSLNLGGTYRRQDETNIPDLEQKRIFVSLSFTLPEFVRFEK